MRQLILDTETTGLYPEKGHRIIEFAALEMIDRKLTGNYLQLYINPEREIDADATKIHGIKNEDVIDKPVFAELVEQIIEYIKDAELIIHNAKFDLSFMDYQFKLHDYQPTQNYVKNIIDTLNMARQKFPGGKNSLDALCDKFNIDRSKRDYHGAL
ncbi:MAG TPA: DNA polymerase III subunit epsilon, partial [Burkholderiales bacterium]|nr:DNA polymerase III subunit epsilon [Burkholderiales bacterium]